MGLESTWTAEGATRTTNNVQFSGVATVGGGTTRAGVCTGAYVDSHQGKVRIAIQRQLGSVGGPYAHYLEEFQAIDATTGLVDASDTLHVEIDIKSWQTKAPVQFMMVQP